MKLMRIKIICTLLLMSLVAMAQETPQFSYNNCEGWTYSGGKLPSSNVFLYNTSDGRVLTLISPEFSCQGIDSLAVVVTWKSYDPDIALTTAIDDQQGLPVDSATSLPSSSASIQLLSFTIPISAHGLTSARLRFVSWDATVYNAGAILKVETSAIAATHGSIIPGDVDDNGETNIADVTSLIDYLLIGPSATPVNLEAADVDHDGSIGIGDVTALIDHLLS